MQVHKKEMPAAELEQEIMDFLMQRATRGGGRHTGPGCNLRHGKACVLATCHDDVPRATPVDFWCDTTLTVWINAEPGGKVANIMRNPHVAVGIHEPVDHAVEQKSLQLWGTAEIINLKNNPGLFNAKLEEFGLPEAMAGMIEDMVRRGHVPRGAEQETAGKIRKQLNLIKITPVKIILLHMRPGQRPLKKFWENGTALVQEGVV